MLFDTTVRRELAHGFGATMVIMLTIVLTMMLIRTIAYAANGVVSPNDVVLLLGYNAIKYLPIILSLSLFVAVVVTLGRMYRDSEMVVWHTSGISLARFMRPVLRTSWPVLAVIVVLVLFVWPWGNQRTIELVDRYKHRPDLARVQPGVFQTSRDGTSVFFVERERDAREAARNVFVLQRGEGREAVTSAQSGRLVDEGADRWLALERGQRNETDTLRGEHTLTAFERYRALAEEGAVQRAQEQPPRTMRTIDLVRDPSPQHQGELAWRLGMLLAAGNLLLLAVVLAHANPRHPSSRGLILALLAFVVYFNFVNLTQAWVTAGKAALGPALAGLHGGAFVVALALLLWRDHAAVAPRWRPWRRGS